MPFEHKNIAKDGMHIIHRWKVADDIELNALLVSAEDTDKLALKVDNDTYYRLKSHDPVEWVVVQDLSEYYKTTEVDTFLSSKVDDTDPRLSDARDWNVLEVTQLEAEERTSPDSKKWSPLRVGQSIDAWWNGKNLETKINDLPTAPELTATFDTKVDKITGKGLSDENYTSEEKTKLAGLESSKFKGLYATLLDLQNTYPTSDAGDYAFVDGGIGNPNELYVWDAGAWEKVSGDITTATPAQIKDLLLQNADTNNFGDAELLAVQNSATETQLSDGLAVKVDKVSGKQLSTEDYTSTEKSKLAGVEANATKEVKATEADALDGSEDSKFMTASKTHQAFNQYGFGSTIGNPLSNVTSGITQLFRFDYDDTAPFSNGLGFRLARNDSGEWVDLGFSRATKPGFAIRYNTSGNTSDWYYGLTTYDKANTETVKLGSNDDKYVTPAGVFQAFNQYGLGVTLSNPTAVPDIDALDIPTGTHQFATGNEGTYPGVGTVVGSLHVSHYRIGTGSIILQQIAHAARVTGGGEVYKREYQSGEWSGWSKILHTGDKASAVEAQIGADNTKYVTPETVHKAFNQYGLGGSGSFSLADMNQMNVGYLGYISSAAINKPFLGTTGGGAISTKSPNNNANLILQIQADCANGTGIAYRTSDNSGSFRNWDAFVTESKKATNSTPDTDDDKYMTKKQVLDLLTEKGLIT